MTQNEHIMLAGILIVIIHKIMWHLVLKHHPITKKNIREWEEIFNDLLRKF